MRETSLIETSLIMYIRFVSNTDFYMRETSFIDQSSQSNLLFKSWEKFYSLVGFFKLVADLEGQVQVSEQHLQFTVFK